MLPSTWLFFALPAGIALLLALKSFRINQEYERGVVTTVANWTAAIVQAAETAMRDAIGQSDLDQMLKERNVINARLLELLTERCNRWGVAFDALEIKDLDIPPQMQRAIAKEAEAIREKRARIIKAEGEQEASVKLTEAAAMIGKTPGALELRRLQR